MMAVKKAIGRIEVAMPALASHRWGRSRRTAMRSPMLDNTAPSTQQMKANGNSQINAHPQIDSAKPATASGLPFIHQQSRGFTRIRKLLAVGPRVRGVRRVLSDSETHS